MIELEEERRLAYVGITRAKDILYLSYADRRLYFGQRTSYPPSRFIIDIPENLLEGVYRSYLNFDRFEQSSKSDYDDIDDSINF
jgi:superfamily I DNA/RNA helicase